MGPPGESRASRNASSVTAGLMLHLPQARTAHEAGGPATRGPSSRQRGAH